MTEHEHARTDDEDNKRAKTQHVLRAADLGKAQWALRNIALTARNMATFADSSRGLDPILVRANLRAFQEHLQNAVLKYDEVSRT